MRVELTEAERQYLRSALHGEAVLSGDYKTAAELMRKLKLTIPSKSN